MTGGAAYSEIKLARAAGRVHPWRVLHAAYPSAGLVEVVTVQAASGMRPEVLTLHGLVDATPEWVSQGEAASESLLSAWHDVRSWRDAMMKAAAGRFELVHAHSFSAGMAAVRNCPTVVYGISGFVEQLAAQAAEQHGSERPGAWLSRSLRVAEQFVISRAGALVVHDAAHRAGALDRGADPDKVFVIPQRDTELPREEIARRYDEAYHHASARRRDAARSGMAMTFAPLLA